MRAAFSQREDSVQRSPSRQRGQASTHLGPTPERCWLACHFLPCLIQIRIAAGGHCEQLTTRPKPPRLQGLRSRWPRVTAFVVACSVTEFGYPTGSLLGARERYGPESATYLQVAHSARPLPRRRFHFGVRCVGAGGSAGGNSAGHH